MGEAPQAGSVVLPSQLVLPTQLFLPVPKVPLNGERLSHEPGVKSLPWISGPTRPSVAFNSPLPSYPMLTAQQPPHLPSLAPVPAPAPPSQKKKVTRTHFTDEQKRILNRYFNERNHMKNYKHAEIKEMERESGLSEHQIRIYFQNKRARSKSRADSPPDGTSSHDLSPGSPPSESNHQLPTIDSALLRVVPGVKRKAHDEVPLALLVVPQSPSPVPSEPPRPPPVLQVRTMARIDVLATKLPVTAAEITQAKEFMCSVFDGQYVPLELLTDPDEAVTLVALACIYITRRQSLTPLAISLIAEAGELKDATRLERLINDIAMKMRIIFNDLDAATLIEPLCTGLHLGDRAADLVRTAKHLVSLARQSGPQFQKNPAALAAAAVMKVAKANGFQIEYSTLAQMSKACKWSIKSREEELDKLLLNRMPASSS